MNYTIISQNRILIPRLYNSFMLSNKNALIDLNIHVVKTLKQIRLEAGLRQSDLSQRLGKPQSYVSKYESGSRQLSILEIREICMAVGISLTRFVILLETSIGDGF